MKHLLPLMFVLLSGCSTLIPADQSLHRAPAPLNGALLQISEPPPANLQFTSSILEDTSSHKEYECQLWVNSHSALRFNYIQSKKPGLRPLIVLFNILKDPNMIVTHLLSDHLAEHGYDSLIIRQEYFMSENWVRPVARNTDRLLSYDNYNRNLSHNVLRIIQAWVPRQAQLSGDIGFLGVSMGGFHAVGAAALYPDAKLTIAMMCGANNLDVFKSSEESIVRYNREELFLRYRQSYGVDGEDRLYREIESLTYNIESLARSIETDRIRLIITTEDTSVPTYTQWRLYRLLGGPEALLLPSGHYTSILYYFTIKDQLIEWLNPIFMSSSD